MKLTQQQKHDFVVDVCNAMTKRHISGICSAAGIATIYTPLGLRWELHAWFRSAVSRVYKPMRMDRYIWADPYDVPKSRYDRYVALGFMLAMIETGDI